MKNIIMKIQIIAMIGILDSTIIKLKVIVEKMESMSTKFHGVQNQIIQKYDL